MIFDDKSNIADIINTFDKKHIDNIIIKKQRSKTRWTVLSYELGFSLEDYYLIEKYSEDKNGKKQGKYIRYDHFKNVLSECYYKNGKLHGFYTFYDVNGMEIVIKEYKSGLLIKTHLNLFDGTIGDI